MKTIPLKLPFLAATLALFAAPFASAQLTLETFTAFQTPNTYFLGDWELTGDIGGTNSPRAGFSQGAGFYSFAGGSNSDTASAFEFFNAPIDITGHSLLEVSAKLLAGNAAPTFTISLYDSLGESAFAVFSAGAFSSASFTTVSAVLTFSPGFNPTDLSSFQISGNVVGGSAAFGLAFDNLAVAAPLTLTSVPEPTTYGSLAVVTLALAAARRRFSRGRSP
jgi:hypothetical protein